MIKILFISDREDKISEYRAVFSSGAYEFFAYTDEKIIGELVTDVVIVDSALPDVKSLCKKLKSKNAVIILLGDNFDKETEKFISAFLTENMTADWVISSVNVSLRVKNALNALSDTNKNLADSLYRLNVLYDTSSRFAGTLDKNKLIQYMIEGLDKSLSFSLACTLSFFEEPVLLLNSLYDLSEELVSSLKMRMALNYKSKFENSDLDVDSLKAVKYVKHPANKFTFSLLQQDSLFAPISLGDNLYGCIEIFKETPFTAEDTACFQTIVQQVSLPLKSAALYQEIIETNSKLEKLERLKSDFISIVSHELRTPLTSIKNSLDILLGGKCGKLEPSADKFITMAQRNVHRLGGIINDLLDLSKIEAGKMDFQFKQMNIHSVIEYVKSTFGGIAKAKNLNLTADETENLPYICADSQRLEQALTNLVSNAVKFTPEGKTITVKSSLINAEDIHAPECFAQSTERLHGEYILVTVEDEGIGLAEKDFLQAFDKFAQIENSLSRKAGGSGLGLPIAKQLIEAHDGVIWCESRQTGSKFCFVIPAAARTAALA
ncbi:MAG: HAMP domain-containing histidine kinase [Heliobacteriaceae bacterium]|jgi:signal transduction histidine kinase|nr:HAMP domain-containing histidine kinase [Heliobacteriaceae bacterium]